ncbi:tetraprenyl-beta-curcumene synthase family protein [Melghiribacillus thermohalophilus]|uniref:tetraprenyl-beta-curcumene synthase family protein n=1 Tax=Melghiribacillus thermohalophilus TaxID=1324956 RepID=UPI001FB259CF
MSIPNGSLHLVGLSYSKIFPQVHQELAYWKKRAAEIPDEELKRQALSSIQTKTFHCEGGSVYAILARKRWKEAVRFIVAYQTISDYLDNLCDRSTSLDPVDFSFLHQSMTDALTPGHVIKNYYKYRIEQEDNGYLVELVTTCQKTLSHIDRYEEIQPFLQKLASLYIDLQVHKHVKKEERVPRLKNWFQNYSSSWPDLSWYEFSACAGSTLGIFALVSYGLDGRASSQLAEKIFESYFPYMQGLHILLDYYIDQQEDEEEGDLNFCSYYPDELVMEKRFLYFIKETEERLRSLPDRRFHRLVAKGLVGMYLADKKVKQIKHANRMIPKLLNEAGLKAKFFYVNTKLYHKVRPVMSLLNYTPVSGQITKSP